MSTTIHCSTEPATVRPCAIRYIGVGGAGAKFIELLSASGFAADSLAALGSDESKLRELMVPRKLLLQSRLLRGLGTSGDPDLGRAAAEELAAPIKQLCEGVETVVLIAGMGGGTGTGAAPVVARIAHEAGALVLAFAVMPFDCEGKRKAAQSVIGLEQLKAVADGVLCFSNQKLFQTIQGGRTLKDAFRAGNDHLFGGVQSIHRLLTQRGLIEIKFSTLCGALRGRHAESSFATVQSDGEDRVQAALNRLLTHPMLDNGESLSEADILIASLTGGADLGMDEIDRLMKELQERCGQAEVIFGADVDESFNGRLSLTVIATQRKAIEVAEVTRGSLTNHAPSRLGEGSFDSAMGTTFLDEATETARTNSRVLPPPPELSEEKRWEVLQKQGSKGRRKGGPRMKQGQLPLQIISKGRFDKTEPTLYNGEDLDLPTYLRRGVALN